MSDGATLLFSGGGGTGVARGRVRACVRTCVWACACTCTHVRACVCASVCELFPGFSYLISPAVSQAQN